MKSPYAVIVMTASPFILLFLIYLPIESVAVLSQLPLQKISKPKQNTQRSGMGTPVITLNKLQLFQQDFATLNTPHAQMSNKALNSCIHLIQKRQKDYTPDHPAQKTGVMETHFAQKIIGAQQKLSTISHASYDRRLQKQKLNLHALESLLTSINTR